MRSPEFHYSAQKWAICLPKKLAVCGYLGGCDTFWCAAMDVLTPPPEISEQTGRSKNFVFDVFGVFPRLSPFFFWKYCLSIFFPSFSRALNSAKHPENTPPTGWRRLIGSPELQIIFHKRATKYRSLLRKMTCKDKGSYESSPPS